MTAWCRNCGPATAWSTGSSTTPTAGTATRPGTTRSAGSTTCCPATAAPASTSIPSRGGLGEFSTCSNASTPAANDFYVQAKGAFDGNTYPRLKMVPGLRRQRRAQGRPRLPEQLQQLRPARHHQAGQLQTSSRRRCCRTRDPWASGGVPGGRSPGLAGQGPRDGVAGAAGHRGASGGRSPGLAGQGPRDGVRRGRRPPGGSGGRSPGLAALLPDLASQGPEHVTDGRHLAVAAADQVGDHAGPAGLVRRAEACPVVAVEVLAETMFVLPRRGRAAAGRPARSRACGRPGRPGTAR